MAEPTDQQKIEAAQKALAAMTPPRTEEDIAPNTLEAVVTVVWSQMALVPAATDSGSAAPTAAQTLMCELVQPRTPAQEVKAVALNKDLAALAEEIRHTPLPKT